MIVNKDKLRFGVTDLIMIVLSALYFAGIRTWFAVCEPMGDSFMSCHWAGEVLKASSVVLLVISVIHLIISDGKIKIGTDISLLCFYVLIFCIPGKIISLCKMEEMSCRKDTQLWTVILMIVLLLAAVGDIIFYLADDSKEKHKRKDLRKEENA